MISTVKSNKNIMLDKSAHFRKTKGGYDPNKANQFDFPETTPEIIREIQERFRVERKRRLIKILLIVVLFLSVAIYLIL